jgi:spore germination protein YaaH
MGDDEIGRRGERPTDAAAAPGGAAQGGAAGASAAGGEAEPPRAHDPRSRPPRSRKSHRPFFIALLVGALLICLFLLIDAVRQHQHLGRPGKPPLGYLRKPLGGRQFRVSAWSLGDASSLELATAANAVDEIDFDWYTSQRDGSVAAHQEDLNLVAAARAHDLNIFATVTAAGGGSGGYDKSAAAAILASPDSRRQHIANLVALVVDKGYDGIDLDWEGLKASDRDRFATFVAELAAALHAKHRFLSIAVFPKTSEPGRWDNPIAEDYARIGAAVDEFKIMTYNYSGSWSAPGPQAPAAWLNAVLTFAESTVAPAKISMGVPFYGYDWHNGSTSTFLESNAVTAAATYNLEVARERRSNEAQLTFTDSGGVSHVAIYQDPAAISTKLRSLADKHPHIAGIAIWVMGQEDPSFWTVIEEKLR